MNSDRWRQIDELFQACLEVEGERRAALLDNASRSDQALREAVEALLASDSGNWSFIEKPALEKGAPLLADEDPQLESGHRIGHYEIVELIGRGGMGEVYLARDQILNRPIALKFLPPDYTEDKDRFARFRREAQATSALNHPNIVTIHELGEVDGRQFIATEYIEGETLRQRMVRGRLNLLAAVEIAIQTSNALAAAHRAGIVHRDIKPENIMLRPDGYVKVLDFGLAKLAQIPEGLALLPASGKADASSSLLMGTVKYMSPEQARGLPVDARSDIFSLGAVLYETITGCAPFEGKAANDLIKSILKDEPPRLTEYLPDALEELQSIVSIALCKDKAKRYQTAGDLLLDLEALGQQLEPAPGSQGHTARGVGRRQVVRRTKSQTQLQTAAGPAVSTEDLEVGTTSSIDFILSQIKQHKTGASFGLLILVAVAVISTYALRKSINRRSGPFERTEVIRLTSNGIIGATAAISPDGKYIAYVAKTSGQVSLWIRQLATNDDLQLIPPSDAGIFGLVFSPDGRYLYYYSLAKIFRMPALGGTAEPLFGDIGSQITFSPDGGQLAFIRQDASQGIGTLVIANADGTGQRTIATRRAPNSFSGSAPSWSPDGKVIACVGVNAGEGYPRVFEVNTETGAQKPLTSQKWRGIFFLAWLSDGSSLLLIADNLKFNEIWRLSYPGGELQKISNDTIANDTHNLIGLSLTADSSSLVTTQYEGLSEIWIAPEGDASRASRIRPSSYDGRLGLTWSPDGRIVFESEASGHPEIWVMNADGSGQKQLTKDANNVWPSVTPDGRYIVFQSNRTGPDHIWRMDIDGGNQKQLTFGEAEQIPNCTPDSNWVVYNARESGKVTVWKIPIDGGTPVQISDVECFFPKISPDGNLIACNYKGSQRMIIPFGGGKPAKALDVAPASGQATWTADGKALTYMDTRVSATHVTNIWIQPIDGKPPQQLTNFKPDQKAAPEYMYAYAWSPDGKQLAYARAETRADVLLIRDVR
ncbi:MAG: protein kinase domain-containing protein [Acidobacteriota bacterium]